MKKNKRKIFFKLLVVFFSIIVAGITSLFIVYYKSTRDAYLYEDKLLAVKNTNNIRVYDINKQEIDTNYMFSSNRYVSVKELPEYIKQAFVVMEDKRFYSHKGVDYIRMMGALVRNVKSREFSEGASTISQQLIKNTHLTREKTIKRKLKEIKLSKMLERRFSKDQILEMYLNNIYFGNGCYGLENASNYYFEKQAKDLSVGEVALLVATINAPSIYDPIDNNDVCEKRKNLVLKVMLKNKSISLEEYEKSAKSKEKVLKNVKYHQNIHLKSILKESSKKLKVSLAQVKNMDLIIETYIDNSVQNIVDKVLKDKVKNFDNDNFEPNIGVLVLDNKTKGVVALSGFGNVDLINNKRQPGSTIKPILVYAPAFEYDLIYPESIIVDEKIDINGYSPSNANKTYLGNVTIRESVEKSLNVPAVKMLSKVGIKRAKNFSEKLGLNFNKEDKNLALALGGMTDGLTIKQLADAYSTFATKGLYKSSSLIKKITDKNGVVLYENNIVEKAVMKETTADLITDLLKGVVNNGTARRLSSLGFDIASKTGTVGLVNSSLNTDAFNVSYTTSHTIVSWIGCDKEIGFMPASVNGSTYPTIITKNVFESIYKNVKPERFVYSEDLVYENINKDDFNAGEIRLAKTSDGVKNKKLALFNKNNLPERTEKISVNDINFEVSMEEGLKPTFTFNSLKTKKCMLIRRDVLLQRNDELFTCFNEQKTQKFTDSCAKSGCIYEYSIKIYDEEQNLEFESNKIKLVSF